MSFDNEKQVIMRKVHSDNPKAPPMRVEVVINGQKYSAGIWPWQRQDGSPVKDKQGSQLYKGKLEVDNYKQEQTQDPDTQHIPPDPFEDSIPF